MVLGAWHCTDVHSAWNIKELIPHTPKKQTWNKKFSCSPLATCAKWTKIIEYQTY